MVSEFRCVLTEKAVADYEDIIRYITVELANPSAATSFADEVQQRIDEIMLFPESGALINNEYVFEPDVRKKLIGNYIMFYRPNKDSMTIEILRIVYGKMNLTDIIGKLNG